MNTTSRLILTAAALVAGVSIASAQPAQDHTSHHPTDQSTQQTSPRQMGRGPAAMGPRGPQGMMMGGNMAQIMVMMQMMQMMQGSTMPMGMMMSVGASPHIDGRIAFLKAELKITDAQMPQWNAFADALRVNMTALHTTMQSMMQATGSTSAPDRIEQRVSLLAARLDAAKAVLAAVKPLYAVLSDEQKKSADELIGLPMIGMRSAGMGVG